MRIATRKFRQQSGSVLMVTLFLAVLFGLFLFSYLNSVKTQRAFEARSQGWNSALAMAEAGGEEALAQLNPGTPLPAVVDRTANGWGSPSAQGLYGPVSRTFSGGSYSVCYNGDTLPIIYSTGYVSVASVAANLVRIVRIGTTNVPLYTVGMATKQNINFNGNNIATDSFNSSNPNLSTNGRYDPTKTSTNGTIASVGGDVSVGNANVNGKLLLGPTASDSIKNNGTVSGGVYYNFNPDFPDVILPQTTWLPATPNVIPLTIDGVAYQYTFGYPLPSSGDYVINSTFTGSLYVGTNSSIRLLINASASPVNIRVAGQGTNSGKLVIYLNGASFSVSGQHIVDGGVAANLSYYGTTNNTSIGFSGNASFTGTIYAPEAAFSLGGGGSSAYNFVGASITQSVTMNGQYQFHFDEALLANGPSRAYLPTSWKEL